MALISFNGDTTIPQPSDLKEEYKQKLVDRTSIKGVTHRYWEAQKAQITATFTALTQGQYAQLTAYVYNQGNGVTYNNPNSGFNFFGYPTVAEDTYIRGASYLKNMTITIVQA